VEQLVELPQLPGMPELEQPVEQAVAGSVQRTQLARAAAVAVQAESAAVPAALPAVERSAVEAGSTAAASGAAANLHSVQSAEELAERTAEESPVVPIQLAPLRARPGVLRAVRIQ